MLMARANSKPTHAGSVDTVMKATSTAGPTSGGDGVYIFFALACAITWTTASGAALAWMHHRSPSPLAVTGAGLSAFGPLLAALAVAGRQRQLRQLFGRWRTRPAWVLLALLAAPLVHLIATALFVALGGRPDSWFHPPNTPEAVAALVVFPLGEEFGWRGFAYPRMAQRHGAVRGAFVVGVVWGLWHLMYTITPSAGGFDPIELAMIMTELPLYALLIAWVFERANRSMAVAIAFHAGAHLDHIERAPRTDLRLQLLHLVVLTAVAGAAAWSFWRRDAVQRSFNDLGQRAIQRADE
jgi:membrane protease YdiL (CAAX protease family)